MKVKLVAYGVTKNLGNYENLKLYAEAEVSGESPDEALIHLSKWVEHQADLQAGLNKDVEDLYRKRAQLQRTIYHYKSKCQEAKNRWTAIEKQWSEAQNFLKHQGLEASAQLPSAPDFAALVHFEDSSEGHKEPEEDNEDDYEDDDFYL